jgi:hypothetical protein
MKKLLFFTVILMVMEGSIQAQSANKKDSCTFWHPVPANYQVKQALEIESLVPMFFTGGYHFGLGYRYKKIRVRFSVINGGTYNAEPAGLKNASGQFKRYYKTSPGLFLGYNIWKNLELYTYVEHHTFEIEQKSTGFRQDMHSTDFGCAVSYQFFIGRIFYVQPGLHLYLRKANSLDFNGTTYTIPTADFSPVLRLGIRYWKRV